MKHFTVTIVILIILLLIITYIETGFNLPKNPLTTTAPSSSTTVSQTSINTTTTISTGQLYVCNQFVVSESTPNTNVSARCLLTTNDIGIWAAAGSSGSIHINIKGKNNVTYMNQTLTYSCTTFIENFTGPKQIYNITITTGSGNGSGRCGLSTLKFNNTTIPPAAVYDFIYNGNFSNGAYTGWNVSGAGFGSAPLNLSYGQTSNTIRCYVGSPWTNIPGQYAASTYACGLQASPGNITSSPFLVADPFLNFKIISKPQANLYVEVMVGTAPAIIAVYNTYNVSLPGNSSSTFRNATIPLTTIAGKVARIKVVAGTPTKQNFMTVGGFYLSGKPYATETTPTNLTFFNST
jgi:hypothetical protein